MTSCIRNLFFLAQNLRNAICESQLTATVRNRDYSHAVKMAAPKQERDLVAAEEESEVHEAVEHAFFPCGQYAPDRDALLPYRCTLEDGHTGVHVAWAGKLPIAEWSDESRFVYEPNTSPTAVPASLVGDLSTANPPAAVDNAPMADSDIPPSPSTMGAPNEELVDLIAETLFKNRGMSFRGQARKVAELIEKATPPAQSVETGLDMGGIHAAEFFPQYRKK